MMFLMEPIIHLEVPAAASKTDKLPTSATIHINCATTVNCSRSPRAVHPSMEALSEAKASTRAIICVCGRAPIDHIGSVTT